MTTQRPEHDAELAGLVLGLVIGVFVACFLFVALFSSAIRPAPNVTYPLLSGR